MQIESLKTFCDLAETKSFTKTAQINRVTQSAVSQTISAIEMRFKSLLCERSKRNFRLTTEGQLVYDESKKILQKFDALQSEMQEIKHEVSGTIRLSTVYSLGLYKVPPHLNLFLKAFPTVNVQVEYRRSNQVYQDVLTSMADLGLVNFPVASSKLQIVPMAEEPLVLVCHPQHPYARLKTIHIKALNGQKFVSFQPDMPTRQMLDKILQKEGVAVEHVMELDNIETLKQVVKLDSAVAILPAGTVDLEVSKRTLATVKLAGKYTRKWGVIYRSDKVLSPGMKQFIKLLKKPL